MNRSGYSDDIDDTWAHIRWRGAVASAIRGERGQQLLREIAVTMDAMPIKELIAHDLQVGGSFCTLGVVGAARGIDMSHLDPEDPKQVAKVFGIAPALAQEIVFENDEGIDDYEWVDIEICGPMRQHYPDWSRHTRTVRVPSKNVEARRWWHMRAWVTEHLKTEGGRA